MTTFSYTTLTGEFTTSNNFGETSLHITRICCSSIKMIGRGVCIAVNRGKVIELASITCNKVDFSQEDLSIPCVDRLISILTMHTSLHKFNVTCENAANEHVQLILRADWRIRRNSNFNEQDDSSKTAAFTIAVIAIFLPLLLLCKRRRRLWFKGRNE